MDKNTTIHLKEKVTDKTGRDHMSVSLREPYLTEVNQYFHESSKNGALSGMALLIGLVSDIPFEAVNRMLFSDFRQCEAYLNGFLSHTPTGETAS